MAEGASTGYSNVQLTAHAIARMKKHGYCMADINRMIEQNDERLIMVVKTVLPRTLGNAAEEGRLKSAQECLKKAQDILGSCTRPDAKRKWEIRVLERERVVDKLQERGGSATQLAVAALRAAAGEMLANARHEQQQILMRTYV